MSISYYEDRRRALRSLLVAGLLVTCTAVQGQDDSSGQVEFKPDKLRFSSVLMGRCKPRKIDAVNGTGAAIREPVFKILDGEDAFALQNRGTCPDPLEPGEACRAYVNFCPGMFGKYKGSLKFSGSDRTISLSGSGKQGGR